MSDEIPAPEDLASEDLAPDDLAPDDLAPDDLAPGDLLHRAWGHSFEEDHDGVAVYRPTGFSFPRARGRGGLEFRPDGTFVDVDAGPADAGTARPGSWETAAQDRLRVSGPRGERTLRIVHLSPDRLELEPGDG